MPCVFRPSSLFRLLLGAALSVLISSAAWAQGMYYKEIAKDGRIYVFNIAANAERFEKSGEMGIGITKPGVGPNGETVVGDNERALQLFFFKHGISEAGAGAGRRRCRRSSGATARRASRPTTPISRSRTACRSGSPRSSPTSDTQLPGTPAAGDLRGSCRIRRAKFKLEGWMIRTVAHLRDAAQLAGADTARTSARSSRTRRSTSTSRKGRGTFRVHVGQFKPPFGAQEMTSSGNQMFVDRALVSNSFFRGRETGVGAVGRDAEQQVRMAHRRRSTATA